jgi:endonuclease YncB( thermonuclease family)
MGPQAGWYQDPGKPLGYLRYWDGARWTEHEAGPSRAPGTGRAGGKPTGWVRRHKLVSALVALVVLGWTVDTAAGVDHADSGSVNHAGAADGSGDESDRQPAEDEELASGSSNDSGGKKANKASSNRKTRDKKTAPRPSAKPSRKPTRAPEPRTYLVTRVIDGDTIELGNGAGVRIVGIDTPEVGQCGYDAATTNMARLVLNEQVRLTMSDEDTDHYGRWLRYVNVGPLDAGLQQIRQGLAIARYDSRDGYGFHVREPRYIAADQGSKAMACPKPVSAPVSNGGGGGGACAPGYDPCVPPSPPDVDCADVNGPIRVTGTDPHGLDADGDGVACE